jgi:UDP-MurNAc hydroxylase
MRVRYIYSACVVIETEDATILSDPWFTPGAYDGSWYQYPVLDDPIATIGPVDIVYISHIHPDHYDPRFLRRYFARHPQARLVIGKQKTPYLAGKMRVDGFTPEIVETLRLGATELLIVPNDEDGITKSEIDSALVVRHGGRCVVNLNDNPFVPVQVERLLDFCPDRRVDFALLPYSGAGPFPQTFDFADDACLEAAAARKRQHFLALFDRYLDALKPKKAMPFAGKYYLGGPLRHLNGKRGVPDAVELRERHGDRVVILADGGHATYDLETEQASAERFEPYDPRDIEPHLAEPHFVGYDFEREIVPLPEHALPLLPLLTSAKRKARGKVRLNDPYWLVIRPTSDKASFALNVADDEAPTPHGGGKDFAELMPRLEISIDDRYLFGLLTRLYHWNNAEVGSLYRSRRVPETYRPEIYQFLNMFQV